MGKLIAMDLDGTLLPEGTFLLNPEYFDVLHKLHDLGHVIVAASGRHYSSMRLLLEPVSEDLIFLCGNGGFVICRDVPMDMKSLSDDLYLNVLSEMRQTGGFVCADTPQAVCTDSQDEDFIRQMSGGYRMNLRKVPDLAELSYEGRMEFEPGHKRGILKVALRTEKDAAPLAEKIRSQYGDRANIMTSGEKWVDCVPLGADKGIALSRIQKQLGFTKDQTIAFGDNGNDIGMLKQAGESYCVENGREETKRAAGHVIGPMEDDSVLKVLKTLLRKEA